MTKTPTKSSLPNWMADVSKPTPVRHQVSEAATREGPEWANFRAADGRLWAYRGRARQGSAALIDARKNGTGVLVSEMPGNFAETARKLSEDGFSIGKVQWTVNDGATITGKRRVTAYVLLDEVDQKGRLYASDAQAQLYLQLAGGNEGTGKPISPKGAVWPYVQSGFICDQLEIKPLKGNKSAAAQSIRAGKAIRKVSAESKRASKRLNRELDLRNGGKSRPTPKTEKVAR